MTLHHKYRPKTIKNIVGNKAAITTLGGFVKNDAIPHCMMFVGESGCGKTTLARIMRRVLKCSDDDYTEINTADFRGVDTARSIMRQMRAKPINGDTRVWLIDECHKLTNDAQNALLKALEDPPEHVYFMLATTESNKLLRTIQTRATEIKVKPLSRKEMATLIERTIEAEDAKVPDEVVDKINDLADGSPRKALVMLDQVIFLEEDKMLDALSASEPNKEAIDLCRAMLRGAGWKEVSAILRAIDGLEAKAEGIRRIVCAYMAKVVINNGKNTGLALEIIQAFEDNFFDSGIAGLALACYRAIDVE